MAFRDNNPPVRSDVASVPHGAVTVGTTAVQVLAANGSRIEAFVCNDHASQVVYLSLGGTAEANKGIRVNAAGGTVRIGSFTGAISAIASGASTTVTVAEV